MRPNRLIAGFSLLTGLLAGCYSGPPTSGTGAATDDRYKPRKCVQLKHPALWNGDMQRIRHDRPEQIVAFFREKGGNNVSTIANLSDKPASVKLDTRCDKGAYQDVFTKQTYQLPLHRPSLPGTFGC